MRINPQGGLPEGFAGVAMAEKMASILSEKKYEKE